MAQTTWNDPELRRRILEGLSALSDERPAAPGRTLLSALIATIAVAALITVF